VRGGRAGAPGGGGGRDLELAQLEDGELLAVHEQELLAPGRRLLARALPGRHAPESDVGRRVAPGERGERREHHPAQLRVARPLGRAHRGGRPEQVPELPGCLHADRREVREGDAQVLAAHEQLEPRADAGVRVGERLEGAAVERSRDDRGRGRR
jgi:hypothetical protein